MLLTIPGCKKELKIDSVKSVTMKASDIKITNMIEAFKAKLKSHLKDGELITADSVVWYLEGCINETYARAADSIKIIWEDSSFVEIPLKENLVRISDINSAYDYVVNEISKHYYSINKEKELVFVNVEQVDLTEERIIIEVKDYVAEKPGPGNPPFIPSFHPGDNWKWGLLEGACNGQYLHEKDAATELTAKANILGYGSGTYWFDIYTTPTILPLDVLIEGIPNPFGFTNSRLFDHNSTVLPEIDDCLTYIMMNYYLENLRVIGSMYLPTGKSIMNYFVESDIVTDYGWDHLHHTQISYGLPVSIGQPPEKLPVPHD